MAKKQFKAESKRLMDLMINSIYTHKEIFLRELISNASDAIDKLYFKSLTDQNVGLDREDFCIRLEVDKDNRLLTITDNGIGMNKEELEKNLGTIAKSGSLDFKTNMEEKEEIDIIGQFGVGFYSAFMVAEQVTVISKAYGEDEAWCWESKGADGYTVTPCEKDSFGTVITLKIKENTPEAQYDDYLSQYRLQGIVKKYSDYIRYPIKMLVEKSRPKEDNDKEFETYTEDATLNSMIPLWKKNKSEVTEEEYSRFYQDKFYDFEAPLKVIHSRTEGNANYSALLFIPQKTPYNYYSKEFEKGLQLYASGVLIMEKCADLLPDHFSFVRGLVDSQDLSLNISREMLQHDRQLKVISASIAKKIKSELVKLCENDRETYETFFTQFGMQLKFGVYNDFGIHKDELKDLILFYSSNEGKYTTIKEYVSRMPEGQEHIYYACGRSAEQIDKLPQTELVKDKGYELLYLTEDVDEFAVKVLGEYEGKQFKSVSANDFDLDTEEEKKAKAEQAAEHKELFSFLADSLGEKVKEVRLSHRLKSHPVCLTAAGEISLEMEKIINAMPNNPQKIKAERVLEVNASHPIFEKLTHLYESDRESLKAYAEILYNQALLIEGLPVDDPVAYANAVCDMMLK